MKPYLLLFLVVVAGQSYAAGDCKLKWSDEKDADSSAYTYTGECKNGYADGKGVSTWSDGRRYQGDFKNGRKDGKGIDTWSDGSRYEGDFKNGLQDGKGVEIRSEGIRYEGDFKNNRLNGKGVKTYSSIGSRSEGEFRNGSLHGFGRTYYSGKLYEEGFFIDNALIKECSEIECDPYPDLDEKTKMDVVMSKITTALKEERYKDALFYFEFLERRNNNLPESFYFYQIQTLSKANISDLKYYTQKKAKDYLKKYGSKGKYYAEVVEIMGR